MTSPALVFWAFWAACFVAVSGVPLLAHRIRLRQWAWVVFTVSLIATNIINAILLWQAEGPCLLPHPSMIEYRRGMTLAPEGIISVCIARLGAKSGEWQCHYIPGYLRPHANFGVNDG